MPTGRTKIGVVVDIATAPDSKCNCVESGLYYLQSRYYNPEVGRFINGDAFVTTGQGLLGNNTFIYCLNNAVRYYDPSGDFALGDDLLYLAFAAVVVVVMMFFVPPNEVVDITVNGISQISYYVSQAFEDTANFLEAKTKGKENIRDSGLADVPDAEVQKKAHDKSLPKSEQRKFQKEEKARGIRNQQKRQNLYQ